MKRSKKFYLHKFIKFVIEGDRRGLMRMRMEKRLKEEHSSGEYKILIVIVFSHRL